MPEGPLTAKKASFVAICFNVRFGLHNIPLVQVQEFGVSADCR